MGSSFGVALWHCRREGRLRVGGRVEQFRLHPAEELEGDAHDEAFKDGDGEVEDDEGPRGDGPDLLAADEEDEAVKAAGGEDGERAEEEAEGEEGGGLNAAFEPGGGKGEGEGGYEEPGLGGEVPGGFKVFAPVAADLDEVADHGEGEDGRDEEERTTDKDEGRADDAPMGAELAAEEGEGEAGEQGRAGHDADVGAQGVEAAVADEDGLKDESAGDGESGASAEEDAGESVKEKVDGGGRGFEVDGGGDEEGGREEGDAGDLFILDAARTPEEEQGGQEEAAEPKGGSENAVGDMYGPERHGGFRRRSVT